MNLGMKACVLDETHKAEWNALVAEEGSFSLKQSWEWGAFKEKFGWKVSRVAVEDGGVLIVGAQLLVKPLPVRWSIAYVPRGPVGRFSTVTTLAFLGPYLVVGLLLLLSDLGISATSRMWRGRAAADRRLRQRFPPEALWTLLAVSGLGAIVAGRLLRHVAGGGELPGGVNVAPAFVPAVHVSVACSEQPVHPHRAASAA